MKSVTTSPPARGIWVLAGGAAAALMLAAGTASAATGDQGTPRPVEPAAKPVAKGHEHSMALHRHHAAHDAAAHLGRHGVVGLGHHRLTHHLGVMRLPMRPLHHRLHHRGHWGRLHHLHHVHHLHAAAAVPGQAGIAGQAQLPAQAQVQAHTHQH